MAISDTQKVDYLWKKLGYSAAKTDTNAIKKAPNEAISSPLLMRIDTLWSQSGTIPGVLPGSSTGVVTVYPTSNPIECTEDTSATANRTWKTGEANWISPEFGSTYQVKVYIHTASDAAGASGGDQVFATGSGNDDEWFFDYQAGVLHFIGDNLPNGVSFTGKSVYISGGRYTGSIGGNFSASTMGDLTTIGSPQTTLTPIVTNADIGLDPSGTGQVVITGDNAVTIPSGSTASRPSGAVGDLRVNSATGNLEYYASGQWNVLDPSSGTATALDSFVGDGSTTTFTLSAESSTDSVIVTIQGVVQKASTTYTVSGTTLTFSEAPLLNEQIEARVVSTTYTLGDKVEDSDGDTFIRVEESTDEDTIRFDTAGTQRMIITNTGNVGIGVESPSTALHVAGIITANSIDADFTGSIFADDSTLLVDGTTGSINLNGTVKGHIIPDANETYDLGSSGNKFRDLYLSGTTITLGTETISSSTGKIIFSGSIESSGIFDGDVTGSVFADDSTLLVDGVNGNVPLSVEATNITVTANNSTDETVYLTFVDGATGTQGIETDTGLSYNPSTGILTTTQATAKVVAQNIQVGVTGANEIDTSSGNLTIDSAGGTVTVDDNLVISGNLTVNGTTTTIDSATAQTIDLADNDKMRFGDGNDLEIFHSGTTSYIRDVGDGDLQIFGTDDVYIRGYSTNNYMARFNENSYVQLYYNNNLKFATTTDGIDVTGTVVSDGLTVASDSTYAIDVSRPSAGNTTLRITGGSTAGNDAVLRADIGNTTGTSAVYFGDTDTNGIGRIMYEHNGDFMRFYTSSTEQMRIDSSGNVGIGTTNPATELEVVGTVTATLFDGTATTARYADLAEKYLCDQDYDEGTVVMVGGSAEVTACTEYAYAIGVVSHNPALMMNSELEGGTYIALKGRVPVKVQGPITKGQTLVAGNDGVAQEGTQGRVFAVALESTDSDKISLIEAVIL